MYRTLLGWTCATAGKNCGVYAAIRAEPSSGAGGDGARRCCEWRERDVDDVGDESADGSSGIQRFARDGPEPSRPDRRHDGGLGTGLAARGVRSSERTRCSRKDRVQPSAARPRGRLVHDHSRIAAAADHDAAHLHRRQIARDSGPVGWFESLLGRRPDQSMMSNVPRLTSCHRANSRGKSGSTSTMSLVGTRSRTKARSKLESFC